MKKINGRRLPFHVLTLAIVAIFTVCLMSLSNSAMAAESAPTPAELSQDEKCVVPGGDMQIPYEGMKIKTVLCYGDSNTYGADPNDAYGRHPWPIRWPGRLQALLGPGYHVVEEGMSGRTTVFDDPLEPERNGSADLAGALMTHSPVDIVILALGINDCKTHFHATPIVIAKGVERLCRIIKTGGGHRQKHPPLVVIVSPVHALEGVERSYVMFGPESVQLSQQLAPYFREIAEKQKALFLDAETVAHASPADCLHMDRESHLALAEALAKIIKSLND